MTPLHEPMTAAERKALRVFTETWKGKPLLWRHAPCSMRKLADRGFVRLAGGSDSKPVYVLVKPA